MPEVSDFTRVVETSIPSRESIKMNMSNTKNVVAVRLEKCQCNICHMKVA